jgi:hypothetical protein
MTFMYLVIGPQLLNHLALQFKVHPFKLPPLIGIYFFLIFDGLQGMKLIHIEAAKVLPDRKRQY